jgi:hypothetical protein
MLAVMVFDAGVFDAMFSRLDSANDILAAYNSAERRVRNPIFRGQH